MANLYARICESKFPNRVLRGLRIYLRWKLRRFRSRILNVTKVRPNTSGGSRDSSSISSPVASSSVDGTFVEQFTGLGDKIAIFTGRPAETVGVPLRLPTSAKVFFAGVGLGDWRIFAGSLMGKLKKNGLWSEVAIVNGPAASLQMINRLKALDPDIIFLPHPDDEYARYSAVRRTALIAVDELNRQRNNCGRQGIVVFAYESPGLENRSRLFSFIHPRGMRNKLERIRAHESQLRTDFSTVAKASNQANALLAGHILGAQPPCAFAEIFRCGLIHLDGTLVMDQLMAPNSRVIELEPDKVYAFDDGSIKGEFVAQRRNLVLIPAPRGKTVFGFEPHPDDSAIAYLAMALSLIALGNTFVDMNMTLGYCASMKNSDGTEMTKPQKAIIRRAELVRSLENSGIQLRVIKPNPEHYANNDFPEKVYPEQRMAVLEALRAHNPWAVLLPGKGDLHPTHQDVYGLITEIVQVAQEQSRYINVLFFQAPWAGRFNIYNGYEDRTKRMPTRNPFAQSRRHLARALAPVAGELCVGIGQPQADIEPNVERFLLLTPQDVTNLARGASSPAEEDSHDADSQFSGGRPQFVFLPTEQAGVYSILDAQSKVRLGEAKYHYRNSEATLAVEDITILRDYPRQRFGTRVMQQLAHEAALRYPNSAYPLQVEKVVSPWMWNILKKIYLPESIEFKRALVPDGEWFKDPGFVDNIPIIPSVRFPGQERYIEPFHARGTLATASSPADLTPNTYDLSPNWASSPAETNSLPAGALGLWRKTGLTNLITIIILESLMIGVGGAVLLNFLLGLPPGPLRLDVCIVSFVRLTITLILLFITTGKFLQFLYHWRGMLEFNQQITYLELVVNRAGWIAATSLVGSPFLSLAWVGGEAIVNSQLLVIGILFSIIFRLFVIMRFTSRQFVKIRRRNMQVAEHRQVYIESLNSVARNGLIRPAATNGRKVKILSVADETEPHERHMLF
ncbi:MAG: PIG-L family deacetylase, partial [Planctomycetota bacterium]